MEHGKRHLSHSPEFTGSTWFDSSNPLLASTIASVLSTRGQEGRVMWHGVLWHATAEPPTLGVSSP